MTLMFMHSFLSCYLCTRCKRINRNLNTEIFFYFLFFFLSGALIGTLPTEQHQVSGQFYVIDSRTIFIENFNYDGAGPGNLRV